MSDEGVVNARDAASDARKRLFATAQEIRSRFEPSSLLDDAATNLREQSTRMARTAGNAIRERPAAFGAAAAAGALLIVHRPLLRLGRRLFRRDDPGHETDNDAAG